MNYEDVALSLIQALHAEMCDDHVSGVVKVLEALERAVNERWEAFLRKDTNEMLFYENVCCPVCTEPVQVSRTREEIHVEYEEL